MDSKRKTRHDKNNKSNDDDEQGKSSPILQHEEFSFTNICLHDKNRDLSPADDIFFHGHLLPLHLISHLPPHNSSSLHVTHSTTNHSNPFPPKNKLTHLIKRMVRPLALFKRSNNNKDEVVPPSSSDVVGNGKQEMVNSGPLLGLPNCSKTTTDSTMEELQAAIQAAIAHCNNSIATQDR